MEERIRLIRERLIHNIRQQPALYVSEIRLELVDAYMSGFEYLASEITGLAQQTNPMKPTFLEYLWWRNVGPKGLVALLLERNHHDHIRAIGEYCDWLLDYDRFYDSYGYIHYFDPSSNWVEFNTQVHGFLSTHPDITEDHLDLKFVVMEDGIPLTHFYKGRVWSRPLDDKNEWEAALHRDTKKILRGPRPNEGR